MDEYSDGQANRSNPMAAPADTFSHPRSAVTRFHAQYVRDRRLLTWPEAIAKTSYLPPLFLALQSPDI
jgi:hypothetical protein